MELNKLVFPSPSPSYTHDSMEGKLLYIPKFPIADLLSSRPENSPPSPFVLGDKTNNQFMYHSVMNIPTTKNSKRQLDLEHVPTEQYSSLNYRSCAPQFGKNDMVESK